MDERRGIDPTALTAAAAAASAKCVSGARYQEISER